MAPKSFIAAFGALVAAVAVNAQAAPNWAYIPTACEQQCAETIEVSYLCQQQNGNSGTQTYGCFCSAFPSDASGCASCLNDNDSAALATLLTATETDCPNALNSCSFACAFDTCASTDVDCQCSDNYLSNIYNCASCNTANNNAGTTGLSDFESLRDSCSNQGFAGANQTFATRAANSPTGQDAYQAPTLTASGGGIAATGDAAALGAVSASGGGSGAAPPVGASDAASASASGAVGGNAASASGSAAANIPTTMSRSSTSMSRSASRSGTATGSASVSASADAAATSAPNAGFALMAPATGLLAVVGAVVAML